MINDANTEENWDDVGILIPYNTNLIDVKNGVGPAEVTGSPTIYSDRPDSKYGGYVNFNGTTDRLRYSDGVRTSLGATDFTVECWIYPRALGTGIGAIGSTRGIFANNTTFNTGSTNKTVMLKTVDDILYLEIGGVTLGTGTPIGTYIWTHVAVCREGTFLRFFVDGELIHTYTGATYNFTSTNMVLGGANIGGTWSYYNGSIDDFRFTMGYARYTESFAPPIKAYDVGNTTYEQLNFYPMVKLVAKNGLIDSSYNNRPVTTSSHPSTSYDNPFIDGSPSFHFVKSSVFTSKSADFKFGLNDFTVEMWIHTDTTTTPKTLCSSYGFPIRGNFWMGLVGDVVEIKAGSSSGYINSFNWSDLTNLTNYNIRIPRHKWVHIAWTRSGNTNRIFIGGKLAKTFTNKTNWVSEVLCFGVNALSAKDHIIDESGKWIWQPIYVEQDFYSGYLNDVKVTNLICKYTQDFDPWEQYSRNRPVDISTFDANFVDATSFDVKMLNKIYTLPAINSNVFQFNDDSGFVLKKPAGDIPGTWITNAVTDPITGNCTITLSDSRVITIGNVTDSPIQSTVTVSGTGLLSNRNGNQFTFNQVTGSGDVVINESASSTIITSNKVFSSSLAISNAVCVGEVMFPATNTNAPTSGVWSKRNINTIIHMQPWAKISNGNIELPAGEYSASGTFSLPAGSYSAFRLIDSNSQVLLSVNNGYGASGNGSININIHGSFVLNASSIISVEVYTATSSAWGTFGTDIMLFLFNLTIFRS